VLTDSELAQMQQIAARAFNAIGGYGLARVDFFKTEASFVVTEINTMPGFTPISMYPKLWQASGLAYSELINQLIDLALARK
jgi:D-alanine-D-alanine ligase